MDHQVDLIDEAEIARFQETLSRRDRLLRLLTAGLSLAAAWAAALLMVS